MMSGNGPSSKKEHGSDYFDCLIKSRFIELFGSIGTNKHNYPEYALGDIATITKLAGFEYTKYVKYQDSGDIIMVRGLNCKSGKLILDDIKWIDKKTHDLLPRSSLSKGDLVMTYVGTVGEIAYIDEDSRYHLAPNVAKISIIDKNENNPEYLSLVLRYSKEYILTNASSTTQVAINMEKIRKLRFVFPPIELQNSFVHFVKQVDKSRVIYNQAIEKYDQLIKSRFIELFGHINLNEKNLPKLPLDKVCTLITDGSHYSPIDEPDGKYPMLSVKDMSVSDFDYGDCKRIGQLEYEKLVKSGCKPLKNDILVAKDGSVFQKCFVVTDEIDLVILSSIAILRPDPEQVDPVYLKSYLMSDYVKNDVIQNYTTGTAIHRIILKNLAKLKVMVPDIVLQKEYAEFVKQVDKSRSIFINSMKTLFDIKSDENNS